MTRLSIDILRRPEDELADAIAAADRRRTLDALKIRHNVVVDNPAPSTAAGECRWCPTRRQLASMPDGASRLPQFGRLVASAVGRRAVGKPCKRCVKTALGTLKRRVDAGRPKNSGGVVRGTKDGGVHQGTPRLDGHHVNRTAPPGKTALTASAVDRAHYDCVVCQGMPAYVEPHPSWRTSVQDYRSWVASGRPKRWPA